MAVLPATVAAVHGDRVQFDAAWCERKFVLPLDEAIAYFSERVLENPNSPAAWVKRGQVWQARNKLDSAIADYSEAVRLAPLDVAARLARGLAYCDLGRFDEAITDFTEVLRAHPRHPFARMRLAFAYYNNGDFEKSLDQNTELMRLMPKSPSGYNGVAWIRATAPEIQLRDGGLAVKYATKAAELTAWKDGGVLDTLAAAAAENGDFASAIKWEDLAIEHVPDEDANAIYRRRLDLYKAGQPYREDPRAARATSEAPPKGNEPGAGKADDKVGGE